MSSRRRRSASASAATDMNSAPRWLISTIEAPDPCQSSISACAWRRTDSGKVAGPALKLNARVMSHLWGKTPSMPQCTSLAA
ncbi:hypothetical protein G6F63_016829 [Rhizopus arrhizus]|nr:hypothetical protein G6F63_016829 [Rhizopus arrhizus]